MATLAIDPRGLHVTCGSCGRVNRIAFEKLDRSTTCGQCHQPLAAGALPLEVQSTADFDLIASSASVPLVVDYWAPWCGPCRSVAPELEKVARRADGRYLVLKVNTDVLSDLGARHNIRSIPTLAVFAHGREVSRTTGARPAADIEAFIAQAAASSPGAPGR